MSHQIRLVSGNFILKHGNITSGLWCKHSTTWVVNFSEDITLHNILFGNSNHWEPFSFTQNKSSSLKTNAMMGVGLWVQTPNLIHTEFQWPLTGLVWRKQQQRLTQEHQTAGSLWPPAPFWPDHFPLPGCPCKHISHTLLVCVET